MFSFARRCRRRLQCEWQAIHCHFQKILAGILFGALIGLVVIFSAFNSLNPRLYYSWFPLNTPVALCLLWLGFFALLGGLIAVVSICRDQLNPYIRIRALSCFYLAAFLSAGWFFLLFRLGSFFGATILLGAGVLAVVFAAVQVWRNSLPVFLSAILLDVWLLINLFATISVSLFA